MLKSLIISSLCLFSLSAFAGDQRELEIHSVEVFEVETPQEFLKNTVTLPKVPTNPVDQIITAIDGIIAIGKKIWPIIDAGRPVINTTGLVSSISVLPQIDEPGKYPALHLMANWSVPKVISYRVSYKNFFGSEVVGFTYSMYFQYNGSYQENGKYITSLKVQASEISASWGFNFDASSELISVANVGSSDNPVASAIMQVSYKTRGLLNEQRSAQSFYVDGNGNVKPLN